MSEKVLSTKVSKEKVEEIKSITDEKDETISSFLRELLNKEIRKKKPNWDEPCFGSDPRDDDPKKKDTEVDEIVYGE